MKKTNLELFFLFFVDKLKIKVLNIVDKCCKIIRIGIWRQKKLST